MRQWLLTFSLTLGVLAVSCGGDDAEKATPTAPSGPGAVGVGTPTPEPPAIVKPTPPADAGPLSVLELNSAQEKLTLTFSEFKALPQTEITVNGKKYSGVSLAALGAKVKSVPSANVTVQGYQPDFRRVSFFRYPVADVGSDTVLIIDGDGFISVASTKIPEGEWLRGVSLVAFP